MKNYRSIYLAILAMLISFVGCSDSNDGVLDKIDKQKENKYVTGVDLSKPYPLLKAQPTFSDEPFHALGYGYDITGKYAHPNWIRKKILDPQKFNDNDLYGHITYFGIFTHGGLGTKMGTKAEIKEQIFADLNLNINNKGEEFKNAFNGMFDTTFENDTTFTDLEYHYAIDAFSSAWYEVYFPSLLSKPLAPLLIDYLTNEFKADIESKSAEEIISLYGTHVLTDIKIGWRQDYYYRASSNNNLKHRMLKASEKFVGSTPGSWMSGTPETYYGKENFYAEYISGVDPISGSNAWMFDITNYSGSLKFTPREHSIDKESLVLINWGQRSGSPIVPIYELILDTSKREALEKAYKEYLSK